MNPNSWIPKGARISASWFQANNPPSCLAGRQMKLGVTGLSVTGVIRHVRGDHPTHPTVVKLFVDPDPDCKWDGPLVTPYGCTCDHQHVEVSPDHITAVLQPEAPCTSEK